jgi:acyl phosphate:glycerol-3-phosphate acyltransferase
LYKLLIVIACFLVGYLCGSIPNGLIVGWMVGHKDVRNYGSHNIGGTNTGRVLGKKFGVLVIVMDIMKLLIPTIIAIYLFEYNQTIKDFMLGSNQDFNVYGEGNTLGQLCYYIVPFAAIIGHAYPIYIHFKGGKVVSTYAGTQLCMTYLAIPVFFPIFFITLKKSKYVSLSSIISSGSAMLFSWACYIVYALTFTATNVGPVQYMMWFNFGPQCSIYFPIVCTLAWLLLVYRHRENIKRIIAGTESKITWLK